MSDSIEERLKLLEAQATERSELTDRLIDDYLREVGTFAANAARKQAEAERAAGVVRFGSSLQCWRCQEPCIPAPVILMGGYRAVLCVDCQNDAIEFIDANEGAQVLKRLEMHQEIVFGQAKMGVFPVAPREDLNAFIASGGLVDLPTDSALFHLQVLGERIDSARRALRLVCEKWILDGLPVLTTPEPPPGDPDDGQAATQSQEAAA